MPRFADDLMWWGQLKRSDRQATAVLITRANDGCSPQKSRRLFLSNCDPTLCDHDQALLSAL
jgi:hypothetical protein